MNKVIKDMNWIADIISDLLDSPVKNIIIDMEKGEITFQLLKGGNQDEIKNKR